MNMRPPAPVKLLLVDDHPLVRDGVRVRLEAVPHFEVVGEAGDADVARVVALEALRPVQVRRAALRRHVPVLQ